MNFWIAFGLFALSCAVVINLAFLFAATVRPAATITVRHLRPDGGVRRIKVSKGETIRFDVVSDQPGEAYLHGYGIAREIGPGKVARFAVSAQIEGTFEVELERAGVQLAEVTVEP